MKTNKYVVVAAAVLGVAAAFHFSNRILACGVYGGEVPITTQAVSPDPAVANAAIQKLRDQGPNGLQALLDSYTDLIHRSMNPPDGKLSAGDLAAWNRLRAAIDAISGQRDCQASHLYWYTDLDQAKAAAKAANKPILSLRLLGKLDEEYSCANSRFFRTTLYANTEVSQYLRDHFILHWKSVRPVPRITIDFGDGRKIERTITGNSIHYILDSEGEVIDALPGLYGAKAFLKGLNDAEQAVQKCAALTGTERTVALRQYHNERLTAIKLAWDKDMNDLGINVAATFNPGSQPSSSAVSLSPPTALAAGVRTESKMAVERPMLKSIDGNGRSAGVTPPTAFAAGEIAFAKGRVEMSMLESFQRTDDATWTRIAALHQEDARLDNSSYRLIQSKYPTAREAGRPTASKIRVEDPLFTAINNLQRSIAEDTVRNEYLLHTQLHQWFISGMANMGLDNLNSKIYAELFLTPDNDPWLGLVPANTVTALDNNGLVQTGRVP